MLRSPARPEGHKGILAVRQRYGARCGRTDPCRYRTRASGLDELTRPTTRDLISPARRLWTFRRFARPSIHAPAPPCMTALSSIGLGFFCFLDSSNAPRLPLLRCFARRFSPTRVWSGAGLLRTIDPRRLNRRILPTAATL